jgi:hypothetical protein
MPPHILPPFLIGTGNKAIQVCLGRYMEDCYVRSNAVTFDEAKKRIYEKHGSSISMLTFYGSKKRSVFLCNVCGNNWEAAAYSVWVGNGCPICSKRRASEKKKHSYEYVKGYVELYGCFLLSENYINEKINIEIKFE